MTKEQEEEEEGDLLKLGSFTVSPTAFHLAPGLSLDLKVFEISVYIVCILH